jgi:hypothetical protein
MSIFLVKQHNDLVEARIILMIYWLSISGYGIALTKGILGACSTRKFCVFKALKEHFPCFLRGIFIKVVNFSHLKIQDFVNNALYI